MNTIEAESKKRKKNYYKKSAIIVSNIITLVSHLSKRIKLCKQKRKNYKEGKPFNIVFAIIINK